MDDGRALLRSFLDMLSAERGAAANTLDAYRRDLEDFLGHLDRQGGGLAAVTAGDITRMAATLARVVGS